MRKKTLSLFEDFYNQLELGSFQKVVSAVYLFDFLDRLTIEQFPKDWYNLLESELSQLLKTCRFFKDAFENSQNTFDERGNESTEEIQTKTGNVYFQLWKDFNKEEFFAQTHSLLKERFEKNGISVSNVQKALDDGCGSGRYSLALKKMGCVSVTGLDISNQSIAFAKKMSPYDKSEVEFLTGSVLELPFDEESFDFIFSNGVLHHTYSTDKGLQEIYRVLQKGGKCWLYLYGGKETLFWDIVDLCRKLLSSIPQPYTQNVMKALGYPPGRVFHRCDFFYVPIHHRYFESEVNKMLFNTGFERFKRLKRGAGHDWDEMIRNTPSIDPYIYGEGEMRYLIEK